MVVKRVDEDGRIDNQGNFGADGIVGPHHEKEGSFFTIKQVWCPVQVMNTSLDKNFDGVFQLENRYDFTNINECKFVWKQVAFPSALDDKGTTVVLKQGEVKGTDIAPHAAGVLKTNMPSLTDKVDAVFLTAIDKNGKELWRWSWKVEGKTQKEEAKSGKIASYKETDNAVTATVADKSYTFSKKDGQLKEVISNGKKISFANGPKISFIRYTESNVLNPA